jgi:aspartate carbamoyltransferase catalytic subunit
VVVNEASVYQHYGRIRDDFKAIGAEWIILTPHYVRPDWMGLKAQKNIDEDPRAYYFQQALNGVYTRMAIITKILGLK